VFGSVARGAIGDAKQAGNRSNVDDRTLAGGQHFLAEGLRQQEWSDQIDFEHAAIVLRINSFGGAR